MEDLAKLISSSVKPSSIFLISENISLRAFAVFSMLTEVDTPK